MFEDEEDELEWDGGAEAESAENDFGEDIAGDGEDSAEAQAAPQEEETERETAPQNKEDEAPGRQEEGTYRLPAPDGRVLQLTAKEMQELALRGLTAQPGPKAEQTAELEEMARQYGVSAEQLPQLLEAMAATQMEARVQGLMAQGWQREPAQQYVQMEEETRRANARLQAEETRRQAVRRSQEEMQARIKDFAQLFPDVHEFTPEVSAEIDKGRTPVEAYLLHEVRQLKAQLAGREKDAENKIKAVGSAAGGAEGKEDDPFMSGFMSAFNG